MKITKGTHVDIDPGTLVKDYKPLYKTIVLVKVIPIPPHGKIVCMKNVKFINKHYGDKTLLSVMNFHDTKATGYIISSCNETR